MTFYVMIITDVEVLVGSSKAVGTVHDITGSNALISDAPSARYLY
jgi:adenosine/AMP kinase